MLKFLRNKKTAKKIWIGLAVIIIPAFAFWGFGNMGEDQGEPEIAGKIFGKNISNLEFKDSLLAVRTKALMQFGDKLSEVEKYFDFKKQAWERLILLSEAKRRKIKITDKEVIEEIQKATYFQDKGVFSNKLYQQILRYFLRLQPRIFEEQTRQNLILAKLYDQITQGVNINDDQVYQEYAKTNQELSIHYIASLFSEFTKTSKPSEQEIHSYFEQNKAMFKLPPIKDGPAHIPELDQIKETVKQALINEAAKNIAQKKINECAEKLKQLEFNQAVVACGLKSAVTDFFKSDGTIKNLGPAKIFWDTAKKLKDKELSGVISNSQGYYIIKLKSIKPIDENKFLKEKESFSQRLLMTKKNELFTEFLEQLEQKAQ